MLDLKFMFRLLATSLYDLASMDRKVFLIKDATNFGENYVSIRLPRASGGSLHCLLDTSGARILELNVFDNGPRSWFIDDSVCSDGSFYIGTPYNPLFTALHYLYKSRDRAQPVNQLLMDEHFPDAERLTCLLADEKLQLIAVRKGDDETPAYQYSEQRTLDWLEIRTRAVCQRLGEQKESGCRPSVHYVDVSDRPNSEKQLDDASLLSTAFGVVGSYLTPDLSTALRIRLALPAPKRSVSQSGLTAADDDDAPRKKSKSSEIKPDDDYSGLVSHTNTAQPSLTSRQKSLAKSASGTKSILSFFGKSK